MTQAWSCTEGCCLHAVSDNPPLWEALASCPLRLAELFYPPTSSELHNDWQLVTAATTCEWLIPVTAGTAQFCLLELPFWTPEMGKSFRHKWKHLTTCCLLQCRQCALKLATALHCYSLFLWWKVVAAILQPLLASPSLHIQQELLLSLSYTDEKKQLQVGHGWRIFSVCGTSLPWLTGTPGAVILCIISTLKGIYAKCLNNSGTRVRL